MLREVLPSGRRRLEPLFHDLPGWHGFVQAILSGEMGEAFADDPDSPSFAVLKIGFDNLVGGGADEEAITTVIGFLPPSCFIVVPPDWNTPLESKYAAFLTPERRVAVSAPPSWDQVALRHLVQSLPEGFEVRKVTAANIRSFEEVDKSLIKNFNSDEDFLKRGAGFGVEHAGRFVSGCSSYAIGGGKLEIEIETHPDFRRRGFAAACGAALILHCLERGIEPCWDAANEASAQLARKLGFVNPRPYTAYYVHPVPVEEEGLGT